MNITEDIKNEIDNMSYFDLLKKWRFAPSGDPILNKQYFIDAMSDKREQEKNPNEISDLIGWKK